MISRPRRRLLHHPRSGITLLELLVATVVLGFIASMVIYMSRSAFVAADAGARYVRSLVIRASRESVLSQSNVLFSFDVPGRKVRLVWDVNNNGVVDSGERIVTEALPDNVVFAIPANGQGLDGTVTIPVDGDNLRLVTNYPTVTFRRNGSASSTLEVYLTDGSREQIAKRAIRMNRLTARPQMWKRVGETWRTLDQ